eukprot:TRINITY_DN4890_c1_g2_i1.p1 TRINITY_DN4890_c1_g2~~TRINITY_DN4890_c1_g2_i1.p1  ORF type:complete len:171 (+),score=19.64 TRINITY_DN4890_c1_g2_i1:471-983(+)
MGRRGSTRRHKFIQMVWKCKCRAWTTLICALPLGIRVVMIVARQKSQKEETTSLLAFRRSRAAWGLLVLWVAFRTTAQMVLASRAPLDPRWEEARDMLRTRLHLQAHWNMKGEWKMKGDESLKAARGSATDLSQETKVLLLHEMGRLAANIEATAAVAASAADAMSHGRR